MSCIGGSRLATERAAAVPAWAAVSIAVAVAVAVTTGGAGGPPAAAASGLSATIRTRETAGVARSGELVTVGVPVARSAALTSTSGLRLVDPEGEAVPAQIRVTGRWGGAPDDAALPIRWLLVDFLATVSPEGTAEWRLEEGAPAAAAPMIVTTTSDAIVVDTGSTEFTVSRGDGALLDRARAGGLDLLGAAEADNGSLIVTAADGTVLRSRGDAAVLAAEVLETGPVKTVVRKQIELEAGALRDEASDSWSGLVCYSWLYDCTKWRTYWLRATVWETFVAGSSAVRLLVRFENPGLCVVDEAGRKHCYEPHTLHSIQVEDLSLGLELARPATGWRAGTAGGAPNDEVVEYQDSSGLDSWSYYTGLAGAWDRYPRHVSFRGYRTTQGAAIVDAGDTAPGWLALEADAGESTAAVALAGMSRRFPAALRATAGGEAIEIGFYPREWKVAHPLRAGEYHTEQAAIVLGAGQGEHAAERAHAWIEQPLRATLPVDELIATGALDDLSAPGLSPAYDRWNQVTIDPQAQPAATRRTNALEVRDQYGMWGKVEAGFLPNDNEQETSTDLSKYGQYHGFLRQALRLADSDPTWSDLWWRTGTQSLEALIDQGLLYQPHAYPGLWRGLNFAHCFHEDDERKSFPRGGGFGCDFGADLRGAAELYYLTGYPPAVEFVREHADNLYTRSSDEVNSIHDFTGAPLRAYASFIDSLVDAWQLFGERRYLDRAASLAARIDAGDAAILDCPCDAANVAVPVYFAGMLLRALGRYASALAGAGAVPDPRYDDAVRLLDGWAEWLSGKVAFERESPATGRVELVAPYTWNTDGSGNQDPSSSAYRLMAVDGLALAAMHTGNAAHLDTAGRLFEATLRQPFYWSESSTTWPAFTYSTINEAGKLAEHGGYYLARRAAAAPSPTPTQPPGATPSPTPSATPPLAPTHTPSATFSPAATRTPSPTSPPPATATPRPSATGWPTVSPAATPTPPSTTTIRLRGRVAPTTDPAEAQGVRVTLSGSARGALVIAGEQRFHFADLPPGAGRAYTVTFSKPGCSFSFTSLRVSAPTRSMGLPTVHVSCP